MVLPRLTHHLPMLTAPLRRITLEDTHRRTTLLLSPTTHLLVNPISTCMRPPFLQSKARSPLCTMRLQGRHPLYLLCLQDMRNLQSKHLYLLHLLLPLFPLPHPSRLLNHTLVLRPLPARRRRFYLTLLILLRPLIRHSSRTSQPLLAPLAANTLLDTLSQLATRRLTSEERHPQAPRAALGVLGVPPLDPGTARGIRWIRGLSARSR